MNNLRKKPSAQPTQDVITLKSVFGKDQKTIVQPVKDGRGWYLGVDKLTEEEKRKVSHHIEPEKVSLTLRDGFTFDLNDPVQALDWKWVQHCKEVSANMEEAQSTPDARLYVYIESRELDTTISKDEIIYRAKKHVYEDKPTNYINRTLILGVDLGYDKNATASELNIMTKRAKEFLITTAGKTPEKVIELYEGQNLNIQLTFHSATREGIIVEESGMYKFGEYILGPNAKTAIAYLAQPANESVVQLLHRNLLDAGVEVEDIVADADLLKEE
jgi:hypothetical protein